MNKRIFLSLLFVFVAVTACYSQSNEYLGDRAMSNGNYAEAVKYYLSANEKNPSSDLSEKLILATLLKNEFEAMNEAIQQRDADALEIHITNVLMADPKNKFIEAKRQQLTGQVTQHRENSFKGIFIGNEKRQKIHSTVSFRQGIGAVMLPGKSKMQSITWVNNMQFRYLTSFPITFEFYTKLGQKKQPEWGLGMGSCFFVGDHITLDYGIGRSRNRMSFNSYEKEKGWYYRAGVTYSGNHHYGVNYSYIYNRNKYGTPFSTHQLTFEAQFDEEAKAWGAAFLLHIIMGIYIISLVKNPTN